MKERFKKAVKPVMLAMLVIAALLALCACGGKKDSGKSSDGSGGDKTASKDDGKRTEVVVWHLYTNITANTLQSLADEFNDSQTKYKVTIINQGDAVAERKKLATLDPDEYPGMFCGTPSATCYYENLSYIKPLQDFLDADEDDWENELFPNVKTAYSNKEGKMIGAPFGVSCGGYYVNTEMLKAAGYQLSDLTSMEKIVNIAIDVYNKGLAKYGIDFGIKGVDLADLLTLQGVDTVDGGNGYDGNVTKSLITEGETKAMTVKYLELVAKARKSGAGATYNTTDMKSFYNGNTAFRVGTNSNMIFLIQDPPKFEWDFIPFPGIDDNAKYKNCALTEGTGWYIPDSGKKDVMQGAYEFIKFLAKPKSQVTWDVELGYVPYTQEAFEMKEFVDFANGLCPSLLQLPEKMANAPADMRLPYTFAWDNVLDANNYLLDNVTRHPDDDIDKYLTQAAKTLDDAIRVAAMRYKKK